MPVLNKMKTRNLVDLYSFTDDYLDSLKANYDVRCGEFSPFRSACGGGGGIEQTLFDRVNGLRVSLGYAGIDAPGTALTLLAGALEQRLGRETGSCKPNIVYAVESNAECRKELLRSPNPPKCMFENYEDMFKAAPAAHELIKKGKIVSLESMMEVIKSKKGFQVMQSCTICKNVHPVPNTDIHIAGFSCVPYAAPGKQEKTESKEVIAYAGMSVSILSAMEPPK
eukprot:5354220-Pyramimonas_sp.AAC.1